MERRYKYIDLITVLFVTVLLLSNLLSSAKIIDLGTSLLGLQFIFDAGTLVFPISYIFGDVLTEIYGYRRSRRVIWSGFFATALMAFFVWLAGVLPGESLWQQSVRSSRPMMRYWAVSGNSRLRVSLPISLASSSTAMCWHE